MRALNIPIIIIISNLIIECFKSSTNNRWSFTVFFKATNFEIRFHLLPNIKVTKLQDNKSVLIELENSGWRFFSNDGAIGVETGLYFGSKNKYIENQNIFISGITQKDEQLIEWKISKI